MSFPGVEAARAHRQVAFQSCRDPRYVRFLQGEFLVQTTQDPSSALTDKPLVRACQRDVLISR